MEPTAKTRRAVYAHAAELAHQLSITLDKIADLETFPNQLLDRDTYIGSVYHSIDEAEMWLRDRAEKAASAPDAE